MMERLGGASIFNGRLASRGDNQGQGAGVLAVVGLQSGTQAAAERHKRQMFANLWQAAMFQNL